MKLNGVLFDMIGRSRLAHYRAVEQHLSGIEQSLSDITKISPSPSLHLENVLLEEFHHASINVYQAKDETVNTFNIYLLATGILATGMTAILAAIVPEHGSVVTALEELSIVLLIVMGIISYGFLRRFIQLASDHHKNEITIGNIREIYRNRLEAELDANEKKYFGKKDHEFKGVSPLMLITTILLGILEIAGALFILIFFLIFYNNNISLNLLLAFIYALIISLTLSSLIAGANYWFYYKKINKIESDSQKDVL